MIVGFTTAEEIIPTLLLGIPKTYFELDQTIRNMDKIISEHPESDQAPEARPMSGVFPTIKVPMIGAISSKPMRSFDMDTHRLRRRSG